MRKVIIALLSCALILLPLLNVAAQQRGLTIQGKITDVEGNPLPGANVNLPDYNLGSAANMAGEYRFTVPARFLSGRQVSLTVTYMGYHTQSVMLNLEAGERVFDFELETDVLRMDAVVVTGVAEATPKRLLPFTVARVDQEAVTMVPATSAVGGLQGKISGVTIAQGSGTPGSGLSVRLRGATSITGSSAPMYIVDGIILGSNQVDVDALDIESIEVVKGASAASLYGSRAASGVINIRTARGNMLGVGQTKIRVRNEYGFNQLPRIIDYRADHHEYKVNAAGEFVGADGQVVDYFEHVPGDPQAPLEALVLDANDKGVAFLDKPFPGTHYDHMDLFFNPGSFYTNNISIARNMQGSNFYLAFTNTKESGVVSDLKGYGRQNVRINVDQKLRDDLTLQASGYYSTSKRDGSSANNPFFALMFLVPTVDLLKVDPTSTKGWLNPTPNPRMLEDNPLYAVRYTQWEDQRKRVMGNFQLNWRPAYWFHGDASFSYDRSDTHTDYLRPMGYTDADGQTSAEGTFQLTDNLTENINMDITASINKSFGDFNTKTKIRYHYENQFYRQHFSRGDSLIVDGIRRLQYTNPDKLSISSWHQTIKSVGYYANLDMDFKQKYIASLLFRYDGSSLFGEDERWQPYYRASFSWRIAEESFWKFDAVNEFKLRASYGTAGIRPGFSAQYETLSVSSTGSITKGTLGNKLLKPAFSQETEFGIELAFLNRFSLDLTYSKTITDDQLVNVPLASFYGYSSQWLNAGTLESEVFEAELAAFIIEKPDMSLRAGFVFDTYTQVITKFDRPKYTYGINQVEAFIMEEGQTLGTMYGRKWITSLDELPAGYERSSFTINDDGYVVPVGAGNTWRDGISKDLWGTTVDAGNGTMLPWGTPLLWADPETGSTDTYIGAAVPDFNVGFNTTFRWKGLTLYAVLSAQIGGEIYNNTRQWGYRERRHYDQDAGGKSDEVKKPISYYERLYNANSINSHFVEDGTYLKLRELSMNYSLDQTDLSKFAGGFLANFFSRMTFGVIGRNLFTFTGYSGWDPQVGQGDATLVRIDSFAYPHYRTITGVLEFEF